MATAEIKVKASLDKSSFESGINSMKGAAASSHARYFSGSLALSGGVRGICSATGCWACGAGLAFWLGMAAMAIIFTAITGLIALFVKRTVKAGREGIEISDQGDAQ